MMRRFLKYVTWAAGVVLLLAIAAMAVARIIAGRKYNTHWTTHTVSFPIPFPLSAVELETLRAERLAAGAPATDPLAGVDLKTAALTRAIRRGEHLVKTRVACNGCHGVRHTGQSSSMPSLEFVNLSDHELSDIAAYVQSRAPVNRTQKPIWIGP